MKEWVISHVKDIDEELRGSDWDSIFNDIKEANFNFLIEKYALRSFYYKVARALTEGLRCNFSTTQELRTEKCGNFVFIFCSVLSNLSKDNFDILLASKNTFFIYAPVEAHIRYFDLKALNIAIEENEPLKIVSFSHELGDPKEDPNHCWLFGRFAVAHEFGHIILPDLDDDGINLKLIEWGFDKEVEHVGVKFKKNFKNKFQNCIEKAESSTKEREKKHGESGGQNGT